MNILGKIIMAAFVFQYVSCSGNDQSATASFAVEGMSIKGGIL